jgi:hypothetical protein
METRLEITFDSGLAGQEMMAKLEKKHGKPALKNEDDAAWENPSRELIDEIVMQVMEDDLVLSMSIVKD